MSSVLRTMSFNIRCDTFTTTKDDNDYWPTRAPIVTEMLQQNRPHILGVQELMKHQIYSVISGLPDHYQFIGKPRDKSINSEQCAIIYDAKLMHPLAYGTFSLSDTPLIQGSITWGNKDPRIVTWAHFFHKSTEEIITVANTHFDHISEESRQLSAKTLLKYFDNQNTIIMGDFNTPNETSVAHSILTEKFNDALSIGKHSQPLFSTWNNYKNPVEGARIDWILASKNLHINEVRTNTFTVNGKYPSDHLPIEAEFVL